MFYQLIHPQNYTPFNNLVLSPTEVPAFYYVGVADAIKQSWCGKNPRPLPEGYSEYDALISRMMDKDRKKRANIEEVVQILNGMKQL